MALERPARAGMVAELFGSDPGRRLLLLRAVWPHAVGAEVARRTELLGVEGRTLRVRVPDAAWRRTLHRMQREIVMRLRDLAGPAAPARLGYLEGAVAAPPPPAPTPAAPLPAAEPGPQLAADADAISDPEIRALFLEAASRYLARCPKPGP